MGIMKYSKYKPSGVEWIGEIPGHWQAYRLKYVAKANPSNIDKKTVEGEQDVLLCNYVDVYKNEFITEDLSLMAATASADQIDRFHLEAGDVLVTKDSEDPTDIAIPAVVKRDMPGVVCGYHLTHIRANPNKLNGFYLHRLFQSYTFNQQFTVKANGVTRYGLPAAAFTESVVCCPPLTDQQAIASYLDSKTALIDSTIRQKDRLIELLQEERTAIINRAVTRGLDPNVPMKDSGVEWLGQIPEHWDVKKLKYLVKGKLDYGANESAEEQVKTDPRYIRITDFGDDGLLKDETFKSLPYETAEPYLLMDGDVLFARSGATVGKTFQFKNYTGLACFAGYLIRATPDETCLLSDMLYLYTKSGMYDTWKNSIYNQATIQNIGADKYNTLPVPLPPVAEQKEIVKYLNMSFKKIDEAVERTVKEVDLLHEYRTALINEVVTGKRCVT
jgi:type I restriction enzyme S subunit